MKTTKIQCVNPECGKEAVKVIYMGLPMKLCEECHTVFGFWAWVAAKLPISSDEGFRFMVYEGSYWKALWHWLMK